MPLPVLPTPRALGVDDWALRKRQTSGPILVGLARRQPVALLPDRTAETVSQWLREHPRRRGDRAGSSSPYAEGARQGGGHGHPGADRFHLLQNLADALDEGFTRHHHALHTVNAAMRQQPVRHCQVIAKNYTYVQ